MEYHERVLFESRKMDYSSGSQTVASIQITWRLVKTYFWFSRSEVVPGSVHFLQVPRGCWCYFVGGSHCENHSTKWVLSICPGAGFLLCSAGGCCVITKRKYQLVWHPQRNWPLHTWYALIMSRFLSVLSMWFLLCLLSLASVIFAQNLN